MLSKNCHKNKILYGNRLKTILKVKNNILMSNSPFNRIKKSIKLITNHSVKMNTKLAPFKNKPKKLLQKELNYL